MAAPTIRELQQRVNQIVSESDCRENAIRIARKDPIASGLLSEILVDSVIIGWTAKVKLEIEATFSSVFSL